MEETLMTFVGDSMKFIESLTIFLGFVLLTEYKGKNKLLGFVGPGIFFYVFHVIALQISLYFYESAQMSTILNFIILFVIGYVCYKGNILRKIAAFILYVVPALIAELATYALMPRIDKNSADMDVAITMYANSSEYRNVMITLCGQIFLVIWLVFILLWKIIEERRMIKECMLYLILPVYQLLIVVIYYKFCGEIRFESVMTGWFLFVFGVVIDVSVIYLINGIFKKLKLEREISELHEKRQEELAYYMMVNDHMKQSRFLRHEFANQMQVIYGLLETKDTAKVKQMLDKTKEKVEKTFLTEEGKKYGD